MASSSRGDWKKKLQHSLGVSVGVCVCECVDQQCWSQHTHTLMHTPHTHSCTHPGQQVAPQPLTRTNIWQLPHPASSCRMLPAACCCCCSATSALRVLVHVVDGVAWMSSLCLCLCSSFSTGLGAFNDFPEKKANRAKKRSENKKATEKNRPKKSSNFAGRQQKSSSLCQEQQNIYKYIYVRLHNTCCSLRWKIYIFFMKTKRGVAQQSKHTFLSTWNTQRVCKKRVR